MSFHYIVVLWISCSTAFFIGFYVGRRMYEWNKGE